MNMTRYIKDKPDLLCLHDRDKAVSRGNLASNLVYFDLSCLKCSRESRFACVMDHARLISVISWSRFVCFLQKVGLQINLFLSIGGEFADLLKAMQDLKFCRTL